MGGDNANWPYRFNVNKMLTAIRGMAVFNCVSLTWHANYSLYQD